MLTFDEWGPEAVFEVYDPETKMHGFTVIDNTARGPAKGGIRMTKSVTVEEVAALARTMTWKCSMASLPFGGGKSGIVDASKSEDEKLALVAAFGRALRPIAPKHYIAAPDINTAEKEMAVFVEANGSMKAATGKPANLCVKPGEKCGIPHEYGSTGFGVAHSAAVAAPFAKIKLQGARVAIEGFGNVGSFAAKHLTEMGAKIVALSDSKGTIYNKDGIDFEKISGVKQEQGSVTRYQPGEVLRNEDIFTLDVDILIPSAMPYVLNEKNADKIKARLVVEAANIPATTDAEKILHERGILAVPDFVANAGGVISSYAEYKGKNPQDMFALVEKKIKANTKKVMQRARKERAAPRDVALSIAQERVRDAMEKRKGKNLNVKASA